MIRDDLRVVCTRRTEVVTFLGQLAEDKVGQHHGLLGGQLVLSLAVDQLEQDVGGVGTDQHTGTLTHLCK